jgi:hypothetical protein
MTTLQRQRIAEMRAALDELERVDPEVDGVQEPELSDAELDAFIERNRDQIEASIREGRAALARGECRAVGPDNAEAFVDEIMARVSGRRSQKT